MSDGTGCHIQALHDKIYIIIRLGWLQGEQLFVKHRTGLFSLILFY
jgi:hypothetical protein